eukprot:jgi/Undpi1/9609/HiC_scaffold_27.g12065.m1
MRGRLKLIQAYITSLEYNYTGEAFFVKKKDRGFRHVTSTAKQVIREALPIQCVEAVFVGGYLTAGMKEVDRYPVSFRSSLDGRVYRHIVLAVQTGGGVWGALGLSRRDSLMYKELRHASLSELIADFRESYAENWHCLEQVWVGFPLPHDVSSNVPVKWKRAPLQVMRADVGTDAAWASSANDLNRFVACAPALFERFSNTGKLPDHPLLSNASEPTENGGGGEVVGEGAEGIDLTGSPGGVELSPGAASPGTTRSRLGAAGVAGLGGAGGRRRASTPVGRSIPRKDEKSLGRLKNEGHGNVKIGEEGGKETGTWGGYYKRGGVEDGGLGVKIREAWER